MTNRRAWVPFTVFAVLAGVALVVAGLRDSTVRASALGVPSVKTVAVARPHKQVCEGPIRSQYAFRSVVLWAKYLGGKPRVQVLRERPGGDTLISTGLVERSLPGGYGPFTAKLNRSVAGDVPVSVCVIDPDGRFRLRGSKPGYSRTAITGSEPPRAFSLVMLEGHEQSRIGSLPLAFSRAALFRPSWVGTWTFWALLVLLLGTVPLTAVAITSAMRSEDDESRSRSLSRR